MNKQAQAFLQAYQEVCDRYVSAYLSNPDPDDPQVIFLTRDWDYDRMRECGPRFDHIPDAIRLSNPLYLDIWRETTKITRIAEKRMQEYFKEVGYDYAHIPPPPPLPEGVSHDVPIKFKYWTAKRGVENALYYETLLIGQIAVTTHLWSGERTYNFFTYEGWHLNIKIACTGSKQAKDALKAQAIEIASRLSKLTNWEYEAIVAVPHRVQRAIHKSIRTMRQEVLEGEPVHTENVN